MITLPDPQLRFEYENNFYLTCSSSRIGKLIAHYELFKRSLKITGALVECGVFKGSSLMRFAMFEDLMSRSHRNIIGFDTFGSFPETHFKHDKKPRQSFINDAGIESVSIKQLLRMFRHKKMQEQVELVAGDIMKTVPAYVRTHPRLKIALLNLDTDIYEPAVTILEHLYPRLALGGVLILDDYGIFPGETKAVDDYFKGKRIKIERFPFSKTPSYIIKK